MFDVVSVLTLSLAKAMGLYMIAAGIGGLIAPDRWRAVMDGFKANAALAYVSGAFVYALGVAIIIAHNIWTDVLSVIVSLVGWLMAIEGVVIIAYPPAVFALGDAMMRPPLMRIFAIFSIVLGAFLLIGGLVGRAA